MIQTYAMGYSMREPEQEKHLVFVYILVVAVENWLISCSEDKEKILFIQTNDAILKQKVVFSWCVSNRSKSKFQMRNSPEISVQRLDDKKYRNTSKPLRHSVWSSSGRNKNDHNCTVVTSIYYPYNYIYRFCDMANNGLNNVNCVNNKWYDKRDGKEKSHWVNDNKLATFSI